MKINTKPLPGMMELLPEEQIEFDRILGVIKKYHERFGFVSIDTPVIERTETLLAKAGGETEKQIYRFKKGDNDLSLRFDLTVPTARFVAENFGQLQFPFKRSQIGKVYRGERAQRGRFREFYQCDIDVIGRGELSLKYDAEVIAVIYEIFRELNFGEFIIRISNRNLATGLLKSLNLEEKAPEILGLIDSVEKISNEEFDRRLLSFDIGDSAQKIKQFIEISGDNSDIFKQLELISDGLSDNNQFNKGISELKEVVAILKLMGVEDKFFKIDTLIIRGLDYYTGTIFETNLLEYKEIGSVSSGGRYDNLSEYYSKEKLPGVGASIGLTRLFWCLRDLGLLNFSSKTSAEFLIIPFSDNELFKAFEIAKQLRDKGMGVEVLLEEMKIAKALKFADKRGVKFTLVLGEQEIEQNRFEFKNMANGEKIDLVEFLK
jgi:histidine--tRNA ligase